VSLVRCSKRRDLFTDLASVLRRPVRPPSEADITRGIDIRGGTYPARGGWTSGVLEMATANAKSQERASEGIAEKGGQSNRCATARAQEKRSEAR